MDIEEFIRDVQECGSQLLYGERSVMDMIKSCMPRENYGTLYKMDNLAEVITFCKDAYAITPAERAKKAAQTNALGTSTNPFSTIKTKGSPDLAQHLNKLTETLNKIDLKKWTCDGLRWFKLKKMSKCQKDVKMSKRCQMSKN